MSVYFPNSKKSRPTPTQNPPAQVETPPAPSPEPSLSLVELFQFITRVDRYVMTCLWPQWHERGIQICEICGHARDQKEGHCLANPAHKGAPYTANGNFKTVVVS